MKVLITGGMGFFGWNASEYLTERGIDVSLTSSSPHHYPESIQNRMTPLQVLDQFSIEKAFEVTKPDVIVHAAAISAPMLCEQEPEKAAAVNITGTQNVLNVASVLDIPLVFLSTDLVFNGDRNTLENGFYTEQDEPDARIVYGKTKMMAERVLLERQYANAQYERWVILRTALMFGRGVAWANGFPQFAVNLLKSGKTTTLFSDQFRTPAYIPDITEALLQLCERGKFGEIYHCGGSERIDRVSFVEQYCAVAGIDTSGIIACRMEDVPAYTTRVRDVSLDSTKLYNALEGKWNATPLQEALQKIS